jgi:hypothetical protein
MSDEQFEAHIKTTAWYGVLSQAANDDDDGASVFRMARMAASEAWQASRHAAVEEAAKICDAISDDFNRRRKTSDNPTYMEGKSDGAEDCATALLRLAAPTHGEPNV